MNALEAKLDPDEGDKRSRQEKEYSQDIDSMFRTKVNWDQTVGPFKKMQKQMDELQEAAFYKVMEQHADTKLMRAQKR